MEKWKGCIVEESLEDTRVLNTIEIIKIKITSEEEPEKRWHIYNALCSEEEIDKIHQQLKKSWYMHFWRDTKMIVLFKEKKYMLDRDNKDTWKEAVDYGLSINIPKEQLDFEIEF